MESNVYRASSEKLTLERLYALLYAMRAEVQEVRTEVRALEKKIEEMKK